MSQHSGSIEWRLSEDFRYSEDSTVTMLNIGRFFADPQTVVELLAVPADRQGVRLTDSRLPHDRQYNFAPGLSLSGDWGWIACYEEESGCLGESNRLHPRGMIYYRKH